MPCCMQQYVSAACIRTCTFRACRHMYLPRSNGYHAAWPGTCIAIYTCLGPLCSSRSSLCTWVVSVANACLHVLYLG
jgi:hypothetical protein